MHIDYKDTAKQLDIKNGDIIFLSSDMSKIAYNEMINNSIFDGSVFLDILISKIGTTGTLILPVYN